MQITELSRLRKNKKAHDLARETLCKCETEKFSMADVKDFIYIINGMVDKALQLNEENSKFIFPLPTDESFQSSNVGIHQQNPGNHLHQQA